MANQMPVPNPDAQFDVGDVIICHQEHSKEVVREITEKRKTGYTWRYPDMHDAGERYTENSSDPFLMWGWEKLGDG